MTRKNQRIILCIILLSFALVYFQIPFVNSKVNQVFMLFSSMSVESMIGYLRSFGMWAVVVSFFLMMFQSVVAPMPTFLVTFANAAVFGWWQGAILSWTSTMVGALLCFAIARIVGRNVVEKVTARFALDSIDKYFERYGKQTILICRFLPFVSFDFVSYGAGLTSMRAIPFLLATGVGQLPTILIYSYTGGMLMGYEKAVVTALRMILVLFTGIVLIKKIYNDKQREGKEL